MMNRTDFQRYFCGMLLVCCGALILNQQSMPPGEGKITGYGQARRRGSAHEGHRHVEGSLLR